MLCRTPCLRTWHRHILPEQAMLLMHSYMGLPAFVYT